MSCVPRQIRAPELPLKKQIPVTVMWAGNFQKVSNEFETDARSGIRTVTRSFCEHMANPTSTRLFEPTKMSIAEYRRTLKDGWGFEDGNGNLMEFFDAQALKLEECWLNAMIQLKRSKLMQCEVYEKRVKVKIDTVRTPTSVLIPILVHMQWRVGDSVYFPELWWTNEDGSGPKRVVYRFIHDPEANWKCPGCEYHNSEDFPICLLCSTAKPSTPPNPRKETVLRMMRQTVIQQQVVTTDGMNLAESESSIAQRLAIAHNLLSSRDLAIGQWKYGEPQVDAGYEQFLADALEAAWTVIVTPDRQHEIVRQVQSSDAPMDQTKCTCCLGEWNDQDQLEPTDEEENKPWVNCIQDTVTPYPFQPVEGGQVARPLYNVWDDTRCQVYKRDQQDPDNPSKNRPRCPPGARDPKCQQCQWSDWKPHLPEQVARQTCMECTVMGICKMTHEELLSWPKSLHHVGEGALLLPSTLMSLYHDDKCRYLWKPEANQQQSDMPLQKPPHKHLVSIVRILVRAAISAHTHWHECPECQYGFFHKQHHRKPVDLKGAVPAPSSNTRLTCPHCAAEFDDRFQVFEKFGLKEFEVHVEGQGDYSQFLKICRRCKHKSISRPPPATCSLRSCHVCGNWQNYTSGESHLYKEKLYLKSRKAKNVWDRDQLAAKNRMSTSQLEAHNNRFIVGGHNKRHKPGHTVPGGQDATKTW